MPFVSFARAYPFCFCVSHKTYSRERCNGGEASNLAHSKFLQMALTLALNKLISSACTAPQGGQRKISSRWVQHSSWEKTVRVSGHCLEQRPCQSSLSKKGEQIRRRVGFLRSECTQSTPEQALEPGGRWMCLGPGGAAHSSSRWR